MGPVFYIHRLGIGQRARTRLAALLASAGALLVLVGCGVQATTVTSPGPRVGGKIYVYLQPLRDSSSRLIFEIEDFSAVKEDGTRVPLAPRFRSLDSAEAKRERLLAGGVLTAGSYRGLALEVARATIRRGGGPADLRVPDAPVEIEIPFRVQPDRAIVLALDLEVGDSVREGYRFEPAVSVGAPAPVATGLLGVATSRGSDTVTLFDKVTGRIADVVPAGPEPAGVVVDRIRQRAYVALTGSDSVAVLDLQERRIVNRLRLNGGDEVAELALSPGGRTLITANPGSDTVSFIDALGVVALDRVPVGNRPGSVTIGPAGQRAYVFNRASAAITVLDVARRRVAGSIAVDSGPFRGRLNRDGDRLFVIHETVPYLTVIDPTTLSVTERIYVGGGATAIKLDPRNDRIYLARRNSGVIDVYDPLSLQPLDTIPVRGNVSTLAIDDEGNNLLVVEPEARRVRILRLVGRRAVAETDLGDDPFWVALMGER
jgi:YVTN family beta-propeller protein